MPKKIQPLPFREPLLLQRTLYQILPYFSHGQQKYFLLRLRGFNERYARFHTGIKMHALDEWRTTDRVFKAVETLFVTYRDKYVDDANKIWEDDIKTQSQLLIDRIMKKANANWEKLTDTERRIVAKVLERSITATAKQVERKPKAPINYEGVIKTMRKKE